MQYDKERARRATKPDFPDLVFITSISLLVISVISGSIEYSSDRFPLLIKD